MGKRPGLKLGMVALGAMLLGLTPLGAGCVVRERAVANGPGPGRGCRDGVWVEGYRGRRGRWHEGHWRCPGVVERIEID